jgi:hypothetical protein
MASIDDATPSEWDNAGVWGRTVKREEEMREDYLLANSKPAPLPDMCEMQADAYLRCSPALQQRINNGEFDVGADSYAVKRKNTPVFSGVLKYFPLAIAEVARASKAGNDQHNPDTPLHWDRSKSGDELDALARHLMDAGTFDTDGVRHSAKVAWRALANLEKELENAAKGA